LKNDVNVPSKSNKEKKFFKLVFLVGLLKVNDGNRRADPDPDPHQNVMDPQQ
jgi:hypothetical protein